MKFSAEVLEEIQSQNDIVRTVSAYVPLKQKGRSYFGLCPFHNESTPSFSVDSEKQFYYCFGCGAGGNVYQFVMQMEGLEFPEAVRFLAEKAHIALPEEGQGFSDSAAEQLRARILEMHKLSGRFYYDRLQSKEGAPARAYLEKRRISPLIQRKFGLGYAPDAWNQLTDFLQGKGFSAEEILAAGLGSRDQSGKKLYDRFRGRLMFPIFDVTGRVIAFGGRTLQNIQPKYLNSPETVVFSKSKNLYGLNFAKAERSKELLLVEGYMDMLSIYQAGFHNVVASLGTAFNKEHTKTLRRFVSDVILLFDSDEAGTQAARRAIPILLEGGFQTKVLQVPDGKDPDEFIKANGAQAFGRLLLSAKSYVAFQIDCIRKNYNMENSEHRISFTKEAAAVLAGLPTEIEQDVYIREVAGDSGVSEEAIRKEVGRLRYKAEQDFSLEAEKRQQRRFRKEEALTLVGQKGVLQAQKELLSLCAADPDYCRKIQKWILPSDFQEGAYQKLAEKLFEWTALGKRIFPGEIMNFFPEAKEQELLSAIFAFHNEYESAEDLEKAVLCEIQLLKKASLDLQAANAKNAEEIQRLIEETKRLSKMKLS